MGTRLDFDPYAILGVRRNATEDEIMQAYYRAMRMAHPDSSITASATEAGDVIQKIKAAKEALLNRDLRNMIDKQLKERAPEQPTQTVQQPEWNPQQQGMDSMGGYYTGMYGMFYRAYQDAATKAYEEQFQGMNRGAGLHQKGELMKPDPRQMVKHVSLCLRCNTPLPETGETRRCLACGKLYETIQGSLGEFIMEGLGSILDLIESIVGLIGDAISAIREKLPF